MNLYTVICLRHFHHSVLFREVFLLSTSHLLKDPLIFMIYYPTSKITKHLKLYQLGKMLYTHMVSRVDYDCETDRCVGFVLPLDSNGLPIVDSFLAVS